MRAQTEHEFRGRFGKMVKGVSSLLLDEDQLSDSQNMQPGYGWRQRRGMSALTASAVATGLRFKSMTQFRDLRGNTNVILAHTFDSVNGDRIMEASALPPNAITWSEKYTLTAGGEICQFGITSGAVLIANNKDFLIWRGNESLPTGVFFFDDSNSKFINYWQEVTDLNSATTMPLQAMTVDDEYIVISEMPLDTVNLEFIGQQISPYAALRMFYWNGAWTELLNPGRPRSTGADLDIDCSSLSGWADADTGSGVSSVATYQNRQCFKFVVPAGAGNVAKRTIDLGAFNATGVTITWRQYVKTVGSDIATEWNVWVASATGRPTFEFRSPDVMEFQTGGAIGTDEFKIGEWQEVTAQFPPGLATANVWLDGVQVSTDQACFTTTASTDGEIAFRLGGINGVGEAYVEFVKCSIGEANIETFAGFDDGTVDTVGYLEYTHGVDGAITVTDIDDLSDAQTTVIQNIPGFAYKFQPAYTSMGGFRSDASIDDEDCSSIAAWDDNDADGGVSTQETFRTSETFSMYSGPSAAGSPVAQRTQVFAPLSTEDRVVASFRAWHENLGLRASADFFGVQIQFGDALCSIQIASDGFFISDTGAGVQEIGTNIANIEEWVEWTVDIDLTPGVLAMTCDVYKNGVLEGAAVPCSQAGSFTDGRVNLQQLGFVTANQLTYIDFFKLGTGDTGDFGVNELSTHAPMAEMENTWFGQDTFPTGCYVFNGTDFTDYTAYVNNNVEAQFADLSAATTSWVLYVGFAQRMSQIILYPAAVAQNTQNAQIDALEYADNTGAFVSVGTFIDLTLDVAEDSSFSQKGALQWVPPAQEDEKATTVGGDTVPQFWYKIEWDATLSDPTNIYLIRGIPHPESVDSSYGVFGHKMRAWQIAPVRNENGVRYSATGFPNVWNGLDSAYMYFGERPLLAGTTYYNEALVFADSEIWMIQGTSPNNFSRLRLSAKVGISAPRSLVNIESGVVVSDSIRNILAWFYNDGIWMFDNAKIWKISAPDIDNFFDPDHEDYINPAFLDQTYGEYDFDLQLAKWIVYSGANATTPTKMIVMHFPTLWFGIFDYGTDVGSILSVLNNKYYTVAGGFDNGKFYLLNDGITDVDTDGNTIAVDAHVTTRDQFLSFSEGIRERLMSIWTESKEAGGLIELDEYPDGSKTPQNIAKQSMTFLGKIFGALQRTLRLWDKQKTTKFRIRNRSKNSRMILLGYSTTVDRGRSEE